MGCRFPRRAGNFQAIVNPGETLMFLNRSASWSYGWVGLSVAASNEGENQQRTCWGKIPKLLPDGDYYNALEWILVGRTV
jgi:hypothetical protein